MSRDFGLSAMITRTRHRVRGLANNNTGDDGENNNAQESFPDLSGKKFVFRQEEVEQETPLAVNQRQSSHSTPPTVTVIKEHGC